MRKYPATMNVDAVASTLDPNAQDDGGHDIIVEKSPTQDNPGADAWYRTVLTDGPSHES